MKKKYSKVKSVLRHPLFSGSFIMIVGSNVANFFAYIYHLVVGQLMGPVAYGELVSVLAIITMVSSAFTFIGMVVVKFVSASNDEDVNTLFKWFYRKALWIGFIIGVPTVLATPYIANFLHLDDSIIIFLGPILFFTILVLVFKSFLQGKLEFLKVITSTNLELFSRLVLSVALIYLGYSVLGAMIGIFLSILLGFFLMRFFLRKFSIRSDGIPFTKGKEVLAYSIPIFFTSVATNSFFSTDIILVKHFFGPNATAAGLYGALATMGKITFFGAAPIGSVMFPIISKKHAKGEDYLKVFFLSVFLTFIIGFGVALVYYLVPDLAISALYGNKYLDASDNLFSFGIFMAIFTLSSLLISYFLSIKKTRVTIIVVLFAILQAIGIWKYHDTIETVIEISILASMGLLLSLLVYFAYDYKKQKK